MTKFNYLEAIGTSTAPAVRPRQIIRAFMRSPEGAKFYAEFEHYMVNGGVEGSSGYDQCQVANGLRGKLPVLNGLQATKIWFIYRTELKLNGFVFEKRRITGLLLNGSTDPNPTDKANGSTDPNPTDEAV